MSNQQVKYRFHLEVPKHFEITQDIYDLADENNVDLEYQGEEDGVARKTIFFLAIGNTLDEIQNVKNNILERSAVQYFDRQ